MGWNSLVVHGSAERGAIDDLAVSTELLALAAAAAEGTVLVRAYRPDPTVAFSRRETHAAGFERAASTARALGFTPVVRPTGGRAVAYDSGSIILDIVWTASNPFDDSAATFRSVGDSLVDFLRTVGIDAGLGQVPGEYCPGDFSVNARGAVKLIGTSQRVTRGARLFSAVISVGESDHLRDAVDEVYRDLSYPWEPSTFGSLTSEGATVVSPDSVAERLIDHIAGPHRDSVAYSRLASTLQFHERRAA